MGLNPNLSPLGLNTDPFSALEKTGPPEVLAEVNELLIQLEVERNETGGNLEESFESEEDDNDEDTEDEKTDDDFENDDVDIKVL